jgi:hypothetical protein
MTYNAPKEKQRKYVNMSDYMQEIIASSLPPPPPEEAATSQDENYTTAMAGRQSIPTSQTIQQAENGDAKWGCSPIQAQGWSK